MRRACRWSWKYHWKASTIRTMNVGTSPKPHAMAPPVCWSCRIVVPHGGSTAVYQPRASAWLMFIRAMPKNAWNGIVTNSSRRRAG